MIGTQLAVAHERVAQYVQLHLTLQIAIGMLKVTTTAAKGVERRTSRSNTLSIRNQDLYCLRPREAAPDVRDLSNHPLTGKGMAHEDNEAVVPRHHVPAVSRIAHVDADSIPNRWSLQAWWHLRRIGR